jgi:hypothetical protein
MHTMSGAITGSSAPNGEVFLRLLCCKVGI